MASLHYIVVANVFFLLLTFCSAFDSEGSYCSSYIDSKGPVSTNIARLLSTTTHQFEHGARFLQTSSGKGKDIVYGLAQCWGNTNQDICLGCIHDAAQAILTSCPDQSDTRIWYDQCFLRYSQDKFFGTVDTTNGILLGNQQNVTDVNALSKVLGQLFVNLEAAVVSPSGGRFSTAAKRLSKFDTVYGMAQCTKDLSSESCGKCLDVAIGELGDFCSGRRGCRVLYSTCSIRYELYPYFTSSSFGSQKKPSTESLVRKIVHK